MLDLLVPGMSEAIDLESRITPKRGDGPEMGAEVGAYCAVLETTAPRILVPMLFLCAVMVVKRLLGRVGEGTYTRVRPVEVIARVCSNA